MSRAIRRPFGGFLDILEIENGFAVVLGSICQWLKERPLFLCKAVLDR